MSEVISFKVPRELKKKYEKLKGVIDWPSELRAFVEERIQRAERSLLILNMLKRKPEKVLPKGSVVTVIREDRESA